MKTKNASFLPKELWEKIYPLLEEDDLIFTIPLVNRRFRTILAEPLWMQSYQVNPRQFFLKKHYNNSYYRKLNSFQRRAIVLIKEKNAGLLQKHLSVPIAVFFDQNLDLDYFFALLDRIDNQDVLSVIFEYIMNKNSENTILQTIHNIFFAKYLNYREYNPLHFAIRLRQNLGVMEQIVAEEKNILDSTNINSESPVYLACRLGNLDVLNFLYEKYLKNRANYFNHHWHLPTSYLYVAAENGHLPIIIFLLAKKAWIDYRYDKKYTPLYVAAKNGHLRAVEALLHAKANINYRGDPPLYGTPLYIACQENRIDVVAMLLSYGANSKLPYNEEYTPLWLAASKGHIEIIKLLLPYYTLDEINALGENSSNVLYVACQNNHYGVVKFLLDANANLDITWKGVTPLSIAVQHQSSAIVRLICKHLMNWPKQERIRYINTNNLIYKVCYNGDLNSLNCLIIAGADINQLGERGASPLYIATQKGHLACVKRLLQENELLNINHRTRTHSALHIAAFKGHPLMIRTLLEAGIDIQLRNNNNMQAIHLAAQMNMLLAVVLLLQYDAPVSGRYDLNILFNDPKISTSIKKLLQLKLETEMPIQTQPQKFKFFAPLSPFYRTGKSIEAADALLKYLLQLDTQDMLKQIENLPCLQDSTLEWHEALLPPEHQAGTGLEASKANALNFSTH